MRSILILLAITAVCVMTAWAGWTSESLVTGSTGMWREFHLNNGHKVVFGTDGVGHLVWHGKPSSNPWPGVWYNRYNPPSGNQPGYWGTDFAVAPYSTKKKVSYTVPCIALDGDGRTCHVVWSARPMACWPSCPDTLCYRMCTQDRRGNDKWGAVVHLYAATYLHFPVVACVPNEPNHVLVCWRYYVPFDTGGYSLVTRFREYVNGAWTAVVLLDSSYMAPRDDEASIAAAPNGDVFVAYPGYDEGTTGEQIFVKTRHNGVWGQPVNVTKSFSSLWGSWGYTIEVNPITGNPHLVFERVTEVPNGAGMDTLFAVCHTYRNASGWLTTPEVISEPRNQRFGFYYPNYPTMAFVSNGAAHVVWRDTVPSTSGIMYSHCSSEGGTWSTPEWLTSYSPHFGPFITVEEPAHTIRMVWKRPTDVTDEIWWKSNYLGGGGAMGRPVALSQSSIELFPNPSKAGCVTVHYALPLAGPMTITLFDVSGRAVRTQKVAVSGVNGSVSIDVRGLSSGVYVARLVAEDLSVSKSLIVGR